MKSNLKVGQKIYAKVEDKHVHVGTIKNEDGKLKIEGEVFEAGNNGPKFSLIGAPPSDEVVGYSDSRLLNAVQGNAGWLEKTRLLFEFAPTDVKRTITSSIKTVINQLNSGWDIERIAEAIDQANQFLESPLDRIPSGEPSTAPTTTTTTTTTDSASSGEPSATPTDSASSGEPSTAPTTTTTTTTTDSASSGEPSATPTDSASSGNPQQRLQQQLQQQLQIVHPQGNPQQRLQIVHLRGNPQQRLQQQLQQQLQIVHPQGNPQQRLQIVHLWGNPQQRLQIVHLQGALSNAYSKAINPFGKSILL